MSNFYMNGPMSGSLPIVENYFGKGEESDGGSASRSKVSDSSAYQPKPLSPATKTKIRSTFYEMPETAAEKSRPYLKDRNMSIVHHLLSTKEAEYCDFINLSIAIGTYNVNGQFPSEKLTPWLSSKDHFKSPPDIYAVGFQELDLSQQAFLFDTTQREHDWADRVKACLHPGAQYVELRRARLVGMFLLVYIRKELTQHIEKGSLDAVTVGTGLLNRMGNKGGVAIRFKLYDTAICFVNTHLAAGNDELQRRNQDYREISKVRFFQYAPPAFAQSPVGIFDHDMVFWLGDLNYRLQHTDPMGTVDILDVKKACDSGVFDFLIPYDQLGQMQAQNMAFQEFREGPLSFVPTYKYDPGTDNWDSSEKCRVPAWCDRVLWTGDKVSEPIVYTSVPQLRISDHKPVIALFSGQVKRIDQKRYARFYESALREADRLENEWLPTVSIDKAEFTFTDVKYLEPQVQTLTVKNTGQVPVEISFIPKPNDQAFCKRWLLVTPSNYTIKVGGECVLDFQILIDKEAAWELNAGRDRLEDILVLHLEKGKDYFLIVNGTYVPSCFGQSLDALVGLTHPIRGVPVAQLIDLGPDINNSSFPPAVQLPVPKELWRLIDHITKHGLDEPDLFGQAGSHAEFIAIREALDTGYPDILPGSIYSVVEALLRFLDSLSEPVIPVRHMDRCLRAFHDWFACKQVITDLAPVCYKTVFNYLIKFLKRVLDHSEQNGTNANALAMIFAPMFFRLDDRKSAKDMNQSGVGTTPLAVRGKYQHKLQAAVGFLTQFLTHDYDG